MGIRKEARESAAFAKLLDVYENREKALLEWKAQGGKVVGVMGADVPEEILIAAGYLPIKVYADADKELVNADIYLERAFEPRIRYTFEKIVDGTYDELFDHLAVSHSSDFELRMWLYLREIRRSERQLRVPPVEFVDWMMVRRRMYQEENKNVVARFKDAVEKWTGRLISDEEFYAAAEVCNEDHAALREIAALRHADKPRVTGSEALVIIGSGFFMDKVEHAKFVREVAQDAQSWPEVEGKRVFMTGTAQESTELYDLIEDAGFVVVGEDHEWGDRAYDRDTPTDTEPVRAVVDRYMMRPASTCRTLVATRVELLDKAVEEAGAEAVLFYTHEHDESASWDFPEQRKLLESKGVATKAFVRQQWPVAKNEGLTEELSAFAASVKGGEA